MFNYQEVLHFLYEQLPMFHRIGPAAYKPDLNNTIALCNMLGNPENKLRFVHVAGTNGKGSTSHLIASVLQEVGYKTGLFTSPHLKDFRERIRINGQMIPEDRVTEFVNDFHVKWKIIQPSFFEITAAMAFWYFEKVKCDIVVLETGLGGRLDSTNVITPEVAVITNVSFDHMNLLGDTIEKIATEKGGIIKPGIPVVLGSMRSDAKEVLKEIALDRNAEILETPGDSEIPELELKGNYQLQNGRTAQTAINVLVNKQWKIPQKAIEDGFRNVVKNTGLRGRWERLRSEPLVIADVAHNEDGMKMIIDQLSTLDFSRLHIVLGMVSDKDISRVLKLLPDTAVYYFCKADIPRGMNPNDLMEQAAHYELRGSTYESVRLAYDAAVHAASPGDMVLITGSVFTVAEIL